MKLRLVSFLFLVLLPGVLLSQDIPRDCNCSGTDENGKKCSCVCYGGHCVCVCSDLDGCDCETPGPAQVLSLREGTTVGSAASEVSRAIGREVVVRAGADELIPRQIDNATGWQILARLNKLQGVKLAVKRSELLASLGNKTLFDKEQAIAAFPATHVMTVCSVGATLATVLDRISEHTGAAFDVVGDLSTKVQGKAEGTVEEVIEQLGRKTRTSITLASE